MPEEKSNNKVAPLDDNVESELPPLENGSPRKEGILPASLPPIEKGKRQIICPLFLQLVRVVIKRIWKMEQMWLTEK